MTLKSDTRIRESYGSAEAQMTADALRRHGIDCPKVPHTGGGYLHDAADDRPYEVDGVTYCGRCHGWMESPVLAAVRGAQEPPKFDFLASVNSALHAVNSPWRIDLHPTGQAIAVPTPEVHSSFEPDPREDAARALHPERTVMPSDSENSTERPDSDHVRSTKDDGFAARYSASVNAGAQHPAENTAEARAPQEPPSSFMAQKMNGEWVRCIEAQESRPAPPLDWQPIETAPKDGTSIILFDGKMVSYGGWVSAADQGAEPEEEFRIAAGWWSVDLHDNQPTHWMPLPSIPEALRPAPAALPHATEETR